MAELKKLKIDAGNGKTERITSIEEVLDLLGPYLKSGLFLNIELKNGAVPYEGIEEKVIHLVHSYGLQDSVIYSSFNALSLAKLKKIDSDAKTGILDRNVSDCLYKTKDVCGADALHPYWKGINLSKDKLIGYTVRAWFSGHLYPEKPTGTLLDLPALEHQGITDVFLNEPERYL